MIRRQPMFVAVAALCLFGCSSVPFREVDLVSLEEVNPREMLERFALALPVEFQLVNTVSFEFRGNALSAIGYTDIDAAKKTLTVVGLHPAAGIKLFELSGDADQVECTFALEDFTRQGDFARAVADDTRRMYFDRVPAVDAKISEEKYRISFTERTTDGELEYVFAGSDGLLVEKRYQRKGRRIWSVHYYEYLRENGKLYPAGIILKHHEHRYQLVVRLKEIRS